MVRRERVASGRADRRGGCLLVRRRHWAGPDAGRTEPGGRHRLEGWRCWSARVGPCLGILRRRRRERAGWPSAAVIMRYVASWRLLRVALRVVTEGLLRVRLDWSRWERGLWLHVHLLKRWRLRRRLAWCRYSRAIVVENAPEVHLGCTCYRAPSSRQRRLPDSFQTLRSNTNRYHTHFAPFARSHALSHSLTGC